MKKTLALATGMMVLGGCALPVPLQVASWALDGISYIATEKSITDHGLSIVAEKDCALLRGLTEGAVCKEWDEPATLLADAQPGQPVISTPQVRAGYAPTARSGIPPLDTEIGESMPNIEALANFETAAGPAEQISAPPKAALRPKVALKAKPKIKVAPKKPTRKLVMKTKPLRKSAFPVTATAELPILKQPVPTAVRLAATTAREPVAGIYYVIGSFRNYANAMSLAGRYEELVPEVLAANLDGAPVYRVVVGPVGDGRERAVHRRVAHAGVRDSWAIRVVPGDWRLARSVIKRKQEIGLGSELAQARR